jgi:NAD(P)-dependent dehydrogenase (short-subunit alcohol dehydrogenase family)
VSTPGPDDVAPIDDWNQLLRDRVAVITGGADGIGGAISKLFAQHGALVEMAEIDPERADHTRRSIEEAGGRVHVHIVDVTDPSAVERMAADVLGRHGRVDVLVNNVGDYRPLVRFEVSTPESWNEMYTVNLFHVFAVTRAFLVPMRDRGR